jgi:hypothetical protein
MAGGGAEVDWPPTLSARLRQLSSDEGDNALSAWIGATIAMVAMLIAACGIGAAAFFWLRHRTRSGHAVQKLQMKSVDTGKKAWPDPEMGVDPEITPLDKASSTLPEVVAPEKLMAPDKLAASVRLELCEALRGVLEEEISRGLKASGISDRLDRLEQQAKEQQVLSGSLLPPSSKREDLDSTASPMKREAWSLSSNPAASTLNREASWHGAETLTDVQIAQLPSKRHIETRDVATFVDERELPRSSKILSPSARQKRFADPPEKGWMPVDEDRSLKASLVTVSRNLARRDAQTQELHRQLIETQGDCTRQKLEASHAMKKLQDLLSDPTHAPAVQAAELSNLRKKVDDLSTRLADSKSAEMQWYIIAKRQKAFFMQSERLTTEQVNLFRKHPAGELFLAPPPVYLEDDVDELDGRRTPWDIGSSHINPYATDSWPFEPNACAQRCAAEPNLNRWEEEDGIDSDDDSEENPALDGDIDAELEEYGDDERQLHLRLPMIPPQSPTSPRDFEPPEPTEPPEPLPEVSTSARSY